MEEGEEGEDEDGNAVRNLSTGTGTYESRPDCYTLIEPTADDAGNVIQPCARHSHVCVTAGPGACVYIMSVAVSRLHSYTH